MSGFLYIVEYNNYGDTQWETPVEPNQATSKIAIGQTFNEINASTHMAILFATMPCRVAFVPDGEDITNAENRAWPLPADTYVTRMCHMNTAMRVISFPDY